jgi:DNA-binding NtrC family response regulator
MNSQINTITAEALEILKKYRWPGNIRELENTIERSFILEPSNSIQASSLPDNIRNATQVPQTSNMELNQAISGLDYELFKEKAEKDFIINALIANKGKINQTVARANIPKNTLLRKIKKYGIVVKDYLE